MPGRGVDPAGPWLRTELGLLQTGASGWALPDCAREGCGAFDLALSPALSSGSHSGHQGSRSKAVVLIQGHCAPSHLAVSGNTASCHTGLRGLLASSR